MRMNWRSATTCDISNRCPWLSDRKYSFMWKIFIAPSAVTTSKSTPAAAVGREFVLCRSPSDTNCKWCPDILVIMILLVQAFICCDYWLQSIPDDGGPSLFSWSLLRTAHHQIAWALFFFEIALCWSPLPRIGLIAHRPDSFERLPSYGLDLRSRHDLCCRVQLKLSACSAVVCPAWSVQVAECVNMKRNVVNSSVHLRIGLDRRL